VLVLVGAFVAFQVGRQVYASWSIGQEESRIAAEVAQIEAENAALRREIAYLRSDAYITQEARRLMNLGRYGEQILVIPPGAAVEAPAPEVAEAQPPPPLLEQWLDLFFGP
jgi:cell division protein FtsB